MQIIIITLYIEFKIHLTDGHKMKLVKAFQDKCQHTFRLKHVQLHGNFPLLLTKMPNKRTSKG